MNAIPPIAGTIHVLDTRAGDRLMPYGPTSHVRYFVTDARYTQPDIWSMVAVEEGTDLVHVWDWNAEAVRHASFIIDLTTQEETDHE